MANSVDPDETAHNESAVSFVRSVFEAQCDFVLPFNVTKPL